MNSPSNTMYVYCDAAGNYRHFDNGGFGMSGFRIGALCSTARASMTLVTRLVANNEIEIAESIAILSTIKWAAESFARGKHIIILCDNSHCLRHGKEFDKFFRIEAGKISRENNASFEIRHIPGRYNLADLISRGRGFMRNHTTIPPFAYRYRSDRAKK